MKEKTIIKYFNKILKSADKFDIFSINNILLKKDFNPKTEKETDDFLELCEKIERMSTKLKFFEYEGSNGWYTLSDKGRKAKELGGYLEYEKYIKKESLKDENLNINIGNLTQGDNYGIQSLEKIEVKKNKITHKTNPNKNPSIWEIIKSFLSKFWWTIIIPLAIGILLILIEKGKIDIGI